MIKINSKLKLLAFLLITIWGIILTFVIFLKPATEVQYVDGNRLFENFAMTKEIKKEGEKEFNIKKSNLDSLYIKIQSNKISDSQKKILMNEFVQKKEDLQQFEQTFTSEQSLKIWARIKSYTSEFSKENKYKIIISSENKTNILYADESIDVTNNLLTYINKKYEGLD